MRTLTVLLCGTCLLAFQNCSSSSKNTKQKHPGIDKEISNIVTQLKNIYSANNASKVKRLAVVTFVNEDGTQSYFGQYAANDIQTKILQKHLKENYRLWL